MSKKIRKVAILGSGVMGSGLACHMANIGLEVLMLDIVPFDLEEDQKNNKAAKNKIVDGALKAAVKSKPAPLYSKSLLSNITTGNFDDDFDKISDCDWILEVVIERLDIKKQVFEKVDKLRKKGSFVTSNTSGIPINQLVEGRSEDFRKNFCGTHFFNPPRYLKLLEIIPGPDTDQAVLDFFMSYGEKYLGKNTVLCKDTPAFIGNRIGMYSMSRLVELAAEMDMTIEEVDKLTGAAIARPNTGTFRLQDLVGIDTGDKVLMGVMENCPDDEYVKKNKGKDKPKFMQFLLDNKFYGDKTKKGFYEKTNKKDENGRKIILALNLKTLEYAPSQRPDLPSLKIAKQTESIPKRMKALLDSDDKGGKYLRKYFGGLFAYASNRIPEISDNLYSIDDAMTGGYFWDYGTFEVWDMIGIEEGIKIAEEAGDNVAQWVKDMAKAGHKSFYKTEGGIKKYYNQASKAYEAIPGADEFIILDAYRDKEPVFKNTECTVHDIGDGVMCLEFTSKMNAIGQGIGEGIVKAIEIAETDGWNGIVIGNNAKQFSVGANLMLIGMHAYQQEFEELSFLVHAFQQVSMRMRYSAIPVVVATQGYTFGGGCELAMHADSVVAAAESYIGLVEVGVGLIPGGGGTKEFALRTSDQFFEGDVQIPTLIESFKTVATARVATSAHEAFEAKYLLPTRDKVVINTSRNIGEAKKKVLELADNYTQPVPRKAKVLGRGGLATLLTAANELYLGDFISEHDKKIAQKVAFVLCGGDLTSEQEVSEQYLLDIEREAFLSLCGEPKTQERIQYMLQKNKPLRN